MKLNYEGIEKKSQWNERGIQLPGYEAVKTSERAILAPRWIHFGIGNIFRVFVGSIADDLLEQGLLDRGITCVETFDYEIVDKIYRPYDNLGLSVILKSDGQREIKVLGSMAEAIKADYEDQLQWKRLQASFCSPDLQIVSFTITEKGYALTDEKGQYFPWILEDIDRGPSRPRSAMAVLTAMLYKRYCHSGKPVALVSMDNCAQNGKLLKHSVMTIAEAWKEQGFFADDFCSWLENEQKVAFLSTMIDKITPRPSEDIAGDLEKMGVEDMQPVITSKRTYIAPFVNAEKPQYLVIEDRFPNGRPPLEKGFGVYMGSFETVNKAERMKVTACLNPVHSATGPIGVVIGQEGFAQMLHSVPEILKMARMVAYDEGLPMVEDPGILSPKAFTDELFEDRFPNLYLGDTNLRLSTDVSQGVGVRFGETIKTYMKKKGSAQELTAIPLGIAGWLRYMMGVDDEGQPYTLAPDPMNETFTKAFESVTLGQPETLKDQLRPILSNEAVFHVDLYKAGLGEKIEGMLREMIAGKGACMATVKKYMA